MTIKLLIVDDHESARHGLSLLLEGPQISVAETANSGGDAIELLQSNQIDVVLMDVRMPDGDGISTLEKVRAAHPDIAIVMISAHENPTYVARSAALGACDYLLKSCSKAQMIQAIGAAAVGADSPEWSVMAKMRQTMSQETKTGELPPELTLTPRELQVLRHVALGLSNKEIARSLKISVETVKEHVQNILRKVGASDRTDAAVRAVKMGMVD